MGRPLNKRLFGKAGVGPTASGNEIKVNFHNGTAVKEGYIVKQKASKKFVCEEIETAGEYTCVLTTGKLPAALTAGEMSISFKMDDSETYLVSKISGKKSIREFTFSFLGPSGPLLASTLALCLPIAQNGTRYCQFNQSKKIRLVLSLSYLTKFR